MAASPEGISPFAAAAEVSTASPRTASNTSDSLAAKPSGTVLSSTVPSMAAAPSGAILAPAGSLPTPFKAAQQQSSEVGTQLSSCLGTDELGSNGDPGSLEMSRAASAALGAASRKGSMLAGRGSRQPSVPAPGLPRPPISPFSATPRAHSRSLSPGREASPQQQGGKEGAG